MSSGAIYRVRRKGRPRIDDPRGLKFDVGEDDADGVGAVARRSAPGRAPAGRAGAGGEGRGGRAGAGGGRSVRARSAEARRNAVWAATRIDRAAARGAVAAGPGRHATRRVRQAAAHSVERLARPRRRAGAARLLRSDSAANRRAAAEALGRIGDKAAVPALLEAAGKPADRALEHSLTYALIEIADPEERRPACERQRRDCAAPPGRPGPDGRRRAEAGGRQPPLASTEASLKGDRLVDRRPPSRMGQCPGRLPSPAPGGHGHADRLPPVRNGGPMARFARRTGRSRSCSAERLRTPGAADGSGGLRAMARAGLKEVPAAWVAGLTQALERDGRRTGRARRRQRPCALLHPPKEPEPRADRSPWAPRQGGQAEVRLGALAAVPAAWEVNPPAVRLPVRPTGQGASPLPSAAWPPTCCPGRG